MSTILGNDCAVNPTILFCLKKEVRLEPTAIPPVLPVPELLPNTFVSILSGSILTVLPAPVVAALGDRLAILYEGGNVTLNGGLPSAVIYAFDPVGDLNKILNFKYDGANWVQA